MYNQRMCQASLLAAVLTCATAIPGLAQFEPSAVIDTTAGRITCSLFTQQRPTATAHFIALAEGTQAWTAPDGILARGQPFYDGTRIYPSSAGINAGNRASQGEQPAGPTFLAESEPPLLFDRPGRLAMISAKDQAGPSRFLITDHANKEVDGTAVIFGQCNPASVDLVAHIRHTLAHTDNHPATPFAINHVTIVPSGKPLPSPAANLPASAILPPQSTAPLPPPSGPEPAGPVAVIETSAGTLSCRLFSKESPVASATFLALADGTRDWTDPRTHTIEHHHRFYDGQVIDRVLPDYYIQFGDITGDISGDTDIGFRFKNENTPGLTFDRPGRLAFGNGGPDTNNSELFFSLNPMHELDGGFPIIGQCDASSLKVLEAIANLPRDAANRPRTPVVIRSIATHP